MSKPTLHIKEVTIELRNIEPEEDIVEMGTTVNLLKSIGKILEKQLSKRMSWNSELRVQAVLLCKECSTTKSTQVDFEATDHLRLAKCKHLKDIKLPNLEKK
jgi:hypothetical protein